MRSIWALLIVSGLTAGPAAAQTYVAGTIGGEIVRTTSVESVGSTFNNGSGEAFAGALRVGTIVTPRFGVELEFHRPAELEVSSGTRSYLAAGSEATFSYLFDLIAPDAVTYPVLNQRTRLRATTTSALAFARQSVNDRLAIVYLGGVGFTRVAHDVEFGYSGVIPARAALVPSYSTRTIQYEVGPVVGIEVRAGMTEHAMLTAGMRMHALGALDGWLLRPSVGLGWAF